MRNNRNLTEHIKNLFLRFGFYQLNGYAKPYYANNDIGKIYRVKDGNKLKEMKDGATPKQYGRVKLKVAKGKYKTELVHRIILRAKPNPYNKPYGHHRNHIKSDNRLENLDYVTPKENRNL